MHSDEKIRKIKIIAIIQMLQKRMYSQARKRLFKGINKSLQPKGDTITIIKCSPNVHLEFC